MDKIYSTNNDKMEGDFSIFSQFSDAFT